jgi:hypothetical protein
MRGHKVAGLHQQIAEPVGPIQFGFAAARNSSYLIPRNLEITVSLAALEVKRTRRCRPRAGAGGTNLSI